MSRERPRSGTGVGEGWRRPLDEHGDPAVPGAMVGERVAKRSRRAGGGAPRPVFDERGAGERDRNDSRTCGLAFVHKDRLAVDQAQHLAMHAVASPGSPGSPDPKELEMDSCIAQSCSETTEEEWAGFGFHRDSAAEDEEEVDQGEWAFGLALLPAGVTSRNRESEQKTTQEMQYAAPLAVSGQALMGYPSPCPPLPGGRLCEMLRYCLREEYRQHCRQESNKEAVKQHLHRVYWLALSIGQSYMEPDAVVSAQAALALVQDVSAQQAPHFYWLSSTSC